MSKQTASIFFMVPPSTKYVGLYQELLGGIRNYEQLGNRLIRQAEQAHAFRLFDKLKESALILSNIPHKDYQAVGNYFLGVAENRKGEGDRDEAGRLFELSLSSAPDAYKVKAILSLGALSLRKRDFDSALYFYQETIRAGKLSAAGIQAVKTISVMKAMGGEHKQAVKDLENILPVIKYAPSHIYFDVLNSYAVELAEVGRKEEARNVHRAVVASPFASAYPEWRETAEDLKEANHSFVAVNIPEAISTSEVTNASPSIPCNVLIMPMAGPASEQSSGVLKPARVLDLQKWKKKMSKRKIYNSKARTEVVTEKDMIFRIMELFTKNDTTNEQRRKMLEETEKIAAKPEGPEKKQ